MNYLLYSISTYVNRETTRSCLLTKFGSTSGEGREEFLEFILCVVWKLV